MRLAILAALVLTSASSAQEYVTLKGQVKWGAAVPAPVPIRIPPGMRPAGAPPLMPTELVIDAKTLGLKNVIVWLRPDTNDRKDPFPVEKIKPDLIKVPPAHHAIDTPNLQFEPRVLAARAGDTLEFKNSSKNAHNVNYSSDAEASSPLIPPGPSLKLAKPLAVQTTPISFSDNIYPWMAGRIRVFDHPYFAVTDAEGRFEIKGVPAGKWRIVYWHEYGYHKGRDGILGFPVTVKADAPSGTGMELKPMDGEIAKPKP